MVGFEAAISEFKYRLIGGDGLLGGRPGDAGQYGVVVLDGG